MRLINFALLATGLMYLFGCATPKYNYQPQSIQISEPPLGSINVTYVGDSLLRQGRYVEGDTIYLESHTEINWAYTLLAGYYKKTGEDQKYEFYIPSGGKQSGDVDKAGLADPWKSILAYKDKNKLCVVTIFNARSCGDEVYFERRKRLVLTSDSFQQTLIYSGKVGHKINIGYREFSNNYARPAFNNDVEYDISESNIIGYKGAKIEIIEATNEYIKYKVIKNFNKSSM